jgi:hypothetical protein
MKNLIKKSIAAAAAVSSALAPIASQLTTVSAARLGAVAAVSTAAAFAPSAAYAQSGKRVCGVIWRHKKDNKKKLAVFMKVNKGEIISCPLFLASVLASQLRTSWVSGKPYSQTTCEDFSHYMGLNYNICPTVPGYRHQNRIITRG